MKTYPDIDPETLGAHYEKHILAMTVERLDSKADIATQLALRDQEIERLQAAQQAQGSGEPVALARALDDLIAQVEADVDAGCESPSAKTRAARARVLSIAAPPSAQQATGSGQVLTKALDLLKQATRYTCSRERWSSDLTEEIAVFLSEHTALAAATQAQPEAECVKCVRCGHDNWIQEGKAPAQVAAPTTGKREPLSEVWVRCRVCGTPDTLERARHENQGGPAWPTHGVTGERREPLTPATAADIARRYGTGESLIHVPQDYVDGWRDSEKHHGVTGEPREPDESDEELFTFLDGAAENGFVFNDIDATDICLRLFPKRCKEMGVYDPNDEQR